MNDSNNNQQPGSGNPGVGASPPPGEILSTLVTGGESSPWLGREQVGKTIGHYKLLEELGEGGFGIVWRAEQMEPVRREVALKVIKPGMDSREVIARFEAERQALALMDHACIARMFEGGVTSEGRPFFAMEYVKGEPITAYCDSKKMGVRERLGLFMDVCAAVQHAHHKAILHRDLKPANILITEQGGHVVPKVIDFGVAKALGQRLSDKTLFTAAGMAIGTPQYMSPEQAGLFNQDIDTRSDIYSLGVILYELLTGSTPLRREELGRAPGANLLEWLRDKEPDRPSTRLQHLDPKTQQAVADNRKVEMSRMRRTLRGELDWIVMRALEKDRNRRYQTVNALAMDVKRHLNGEVVEAGPPSARYRLGKLARRHRGALVAALFVFLSLIAGLGFASWQAFRARRAERLASERLQEGEAARDAAQNLVNQAVFGLRDKLIAVGKLGVMDDLASAADGYYARLPASLVTEESERQRGSLLLTRGIIAGGLGKDVDEERFTTQALEIFDRLAKQHPTVEHLQKEAVMARLTQVHLYYDRADHKNLAKVGSDLITQCDSWLKNHSTSVWATRYGIIGRFLTGIAFARAGGDYIKGAFYLSEGEKLTAKFRESAGETAEVCEVEGLVHFGKAKVAEKFKAEAKAREEFELAADSFARALKLGGDASLVREFHLGSLHHAGDMLQRAGIDGNDPAKVSRGLALIREALEGRRKLVELEPDRAECWRDLAWSYELLAGIEDRQRKFAEALPLLRECVRCREESSRRQPNRPLVHFESAVSKRHLAEALMRQDPANFQEPERLLLTSLEDWIRGAELTTSELHETAWRIVLSAEQVMELARRMKAGGGAAGAVALVSKADAILDSVLKQFKDALKADPEKKVEYVAGKMKNCRAEMEKPAQQ